MEFVSFSIAKMWHLDHISGGTKYDKFENLTKLTQGECKFVAGHWSKNLNI